MGQLRQLNWLAIHAYGSQRIRARYAGSLLGEFWMVITTVFFIIAVAVVWSTLWGTPIDAYFSYFAAGYVIYQFVAGTLSESPSIIVADTRIYRNARVSPMFSVVAHLYTNAVSFAHNAVILVLVGIFVTPYSPLGILQCIAGLVLAIILIVPAAFLFAMLSVRYRDIIHLIRVLFQVIFLVTPVMWQVDRMPDPWNELVFLNPIAAMLNVTRDALLGLPVYPVAYASVTVSILVTWSLYALMRRRLEKDFAVWL